MCGKELVWLIGMISKYFVNLTSVLIVHNSSSLNEATNRAYMQATEESFVNLTRQGYPISLYWINVAGLANQSVYNELMLHNVNLGIQGYVTILASVDGFLDARSYATERSSLRLKDKYYLFLSGGESPKDALARENLKLYPHHLFVSARKCPDLELWTQKFVGVADNSEAVHLDTFFRNGTFAKDAELYPNKLVDLEGRTLAVAAVTYIPYVVSYFVPSGFGEVDPLDPQLPERSITYTGTEANIVLTFCKLRNCTIRAMPYGKDNWGGIYENGTSLGMIGAVYRKEAEFGIGCYYNWYNEIFETSTVIAKSAVTVLGPAPSLYPAYMTNILPFSKLLWFLINLTIIVSSIVIYGIQWLSLWIIHGKVKSSHASSYVLTLLEIIAIFFQQAFPPSKLDSVASRLFLSALLLAAITLENTYSGQLKSLLTVPLFTEPIDTVKKFAQTGWKWGAPAVAWVLTIAESDIYYEQVMVKKFEIRGYTEMKNASYTGNFGLAVERLHGGLYSFGDYVRDGALDQLILLKDNLFFDWTRGFSVRGWPLMESFNVHILWCLEHGLYNIWERKHVAMFLDQRVQQKLLSLESSQNQKYPPTALSIENITGPLLALAFGYVFATLAFLIEILIGLRKRSKI